MTPLSALGLEVLLGLVIAVVASSPALRPGALAAMLACLATPFLVTTDQPFAVFCLTLVAALVALRTIDVLRDPAAFTLLRRVWHLFAFFDTRRVRTRPRGLDGRTLLTALGWEAIAVAGLAVAIFAANAVTGPTHFALRWGGFALAAIGGADGGSSFLQATYALVGLEVPTTADRVYASRSVREFWGVRWNKAVGTWLRENCHQPLRRRGHPFAGIAAAFLASAVLHCYLVLPALGVYWSAVMALFFLVQVVFLVLERALRVEQWTAGPARVWTIGLLVASSPLFSEPLFRMIDPLVGR